MTLVRGVMPAERVRPGVARAEIRLGLDDPASGDSVARAAYQDLTEQLARDRHGVAGEERRRAAGRRAVRRRRPWPRDCIAALPRAHNARQTRARLSHARSVLERLRVEQLVGVTQPRRAVATPYGMNRICSARCASVPSAKRTPNRRAMPHVLVRQVEPVRVGVDLHDRAGLARLPQHGLHVEVHRVALARGSAPCSGR